MRPTRAMPGSKSFVGELGWIAFDPVNCICATDAHVRVAVGLDYLGAAPVRGTRFGGEGEWLAVSVRVDRSLNQTQIKRRVRSGRRQATSR